MKIYNLISFVMLADAKTIVPAEINKEEISPYWSFNETADISKYEDFDHKKFLGKYRNNCIVCHFIVIAIIKYICTRYVFVKKKKIHKLISVYLYLPQ